MERTAFHCELLPVLDVWLTSVCDELTVDKQALAALRETLGVWRTLACYRGYENPRFWDNVVRDPVNEYGNAYEYEPDNDELYEVTQIGFHDEDKSPSHVMVVFSIHGSIERHGSNKEAVCAWMRAVCRELLQQSDIEKAPLSTDYQCVLTSFAP